MNKVLSICLLAIIFSSATSQTISYLLGGSDWTGTCSTGTSQSPINLDTIKGACDASMAMDITFTAGAVSGAMWNLGYTILANTSSTFTQLYATDINGVLYGYDGKSFRFVAPSEHTISGDSYALEVQFHHSMQSAFAGKGTTTMTSAIVSILFDVDDNAGANTFIDSLGIGTFTSGAATTFDLTTNLKALLPTAPVYYTYQGSLTTPPCSETVNWYVISSKLTLTSTQFNLINIKYAGTSSFANGRGNNRYIQSANGRQIKKGGVRCEEQFVYFFSFFILYLFILYFIFKLV